MDKAQEKIDNLTMLSNKLYIFAAIETFMNHTYDLSYI
jgi:hypothetical protein